MLSFRFGVPLALLVLLSGCLPNLNTLERPQFRYQPEGSGLLRLDPPGVGPAQAVFRLNLMVDNPNAFALHLAGLEGRLFLNGRPTAESRFAADLRLPAQASAALPLEVSVPLSEGAEVLGDLATFLAGEPLQLRLEAAPVLAFGQLEQPLPSLTLLSSTLRQPLALAPPELRLDAAASGFREVSFQGAVYELVLDVRNPNALGFVLGASGLELELAGQVLASLETVRANLAAFERRSLSLRFEVPAPALAALADDLPPGAGGDPLALRLRGGLRLELPGMFARSFEPGVLLSGVLD